MLCKKPGVNECELHWTIPLMSHRTKLNIRILINAVQNEIRPEIRQEGGFVSVTGAKNAIRKSNRKAEDAHRGFIDYANYLIKYNTNIY